MVFTYNYRKLGAIRQSHYTVSVTNQVTLKYTEYPRSMDFLSVHATDCELDGCE